MVDQETRTNKSEVMDAYDAIAPLYEEYSSKKQKYLDAVDELVIGKLDDGARLLDIGAGDGRRLAKIKQKSKVEEIIAVEPSSEMAKICRERAGVDVHEIFAEKLDELNIGEFDYVTALWNVFGHIPSSEARLKALQGISKKLKKGGHVILDVNNRHNAPAYGTFNVLKRVVIDTIDFKESRGDASYDWKIGDKTFKGSGHLFAPAEIEKLFKAAGFKVKERFSLNYATGEISDSKYRGQLFYVLTH